MIVYKYTRYVPYANINSFTSHLDAMASENKHVFDGSNRVGMYSTNWVCSNGGHATVDRQRRTTTNETSVLDEGM